MRYCCQKRPCHPAPKAPAMRMLRVQFTVRRMMLAAVVAALSAWVVADISLARQEAATRAGCVGHLKSIVVGLHHFHAANNTFPPGTVPHPSLPPARRLGWAVNVHVPDDDTRGIGHRFGPLACGRAVERDR